MPAKHKFAAGQQVGAYTIIDKAESKNGHARWNVQCGDCGATHSIRAAALALGATCACSIKKSRPKPTPPAPQHEPLTAARIAELFQQAQEPVRQMFDQLRADMAKMADLFQAGAAPLATQAVDKPKGLKNHSLQRTRMTKKDVMVEFGVPPGQPEKTAEALALSMEKAREMAFNWVTRSQENENEIDDRIAIEQEALQFVFGPEKNARLILVTEVQNKVKENRREPDR